VNAVVRLATAAVLLTAKAAHPNDVHCECAAGDPVTAELSAAQPAMRFASADASDPAILLVCIIRLDNPSLQGLLIRASLSGPSGRRVELGTVSPFPADRPGTLPIMLPDGAVAAFTSGYRDVTLRLEPANREDSLRDDVRAEVGINVTGSVGSRP
jgi:hypothetical protein